MKIIEKVTQLINKNTKNRWNSEPTLLCTINIVAFINNRNYTFTMGKHHVYPCSLYRDLKKNKEFVQVEVRVERYETEF